MIQRTHLLALAIAATLPLGSCSKDNETAQPNPQNPTGTAGTNSVAGSGTAVSSEDKAKAAAHVNDAHETLHDMVPPDTFVWLEFASFDALASAFEETVGDALDDVQGPSDPESALSLMEMMGLPVDKLIRDQPIAFAASFEIGVTEPKVSLMVPMKDTQASAEMIGEMSGEAKATAHGDYVVVTTRTLADSSADAAANYSHVRGESLFGMRVDITRVMDRYSAQLESSLKGTQKALMGRNGNRSGYNQGSKAGMKMVMLLARSLDALNFQCDIKDGDFTVQGAMQLHEGSELAKMGTDNTSNMRDMLRFMDLSQDEIIVGVMNKESLQFMMDPLVEILDQLATQEGESGLQEAYVDAMSYLTADSMDFAMAATETDIAMFVNGVDSEQLIPLIERNLEQQLTKLDDVTLMAPHKGQNESSRFTQYDVVANAGTPSVRTLTEAFGQPRMRLRLLGQGDETMLTLGEGMPFASRSENNDQEVTGDLAWALDQVQGANPAFVSHVFVSGGFGERAGSLVTAGLVSTMQNVGPKSYERATSYFAMGSTEWRMGMKVKMKALTEAVRKGMEAGASFAQPR